MLRRFSAYGQYALGLGLALGAASCATYHDDLERGQTAFNQNAHEQALAIFRALEHDAPRMSSAERAQYAYLRGMTDYRIGYKADARHWLLVAKALDDKTPGQLPADWTARMDEALAELNEAVYTGGVQALQNTANPKK